MEQLRRCAGIALALLLCGPRLLPAQGEASNASTPPVDE